MMVHMKNITTQFGAPHVMVFDNGRQFDNVNFATALRSVIVKPVSQLLSTHSVTVRLKLLTRSSYKAYKTS